MTAKVRQTEAGTEAGAAFVAEGVATILGGVLRRKTSVVRLVLGLVLVLRLRRVVRVIRVIGILLLTRRRSWLPEGEGCFVLSSLVSRVLSLGISSSLPRVLAILPRMAIPIPIQLAIGSIGR